MLRRRSVIASSLSDDELLTLGGIFCRGGWQKRPIRKETGEPAFMRVVVKHPPPSVVRWHFETGLLYGRHSWEQNGIFVAKIVAVDLDDKESSVQPLEHRLAIVRRILGAPDLLFRTPGGGYHLYYFLPEAVEIRSQRETVVAHLEAAELLVVDGNVEVYPSRKVLRLPFGHRMVQLDPEDLRPVSGAFEARVRALIDHVQLLKASPILELKPLRRTLSNKSSGQNRKSRAPDLRGVCSEAAKQIATGFLAGDPTDLDSNTIKMALVQHFWADGAHDEQEMVDLVFTAFEEHSIGHSRFEDSPDRFRSDVRYAFRNWVQKVASRDDAKRYSEQDIRFIRAATERITTSGAVSWGEQPRGKRNHRVELYLAQIVNLARVSQTSGESFVEFDLPRALELSWGVASANTLRKLRSFIFETVDEQEAALRARVKKRERRRRIQPGARVPFDPPTVQSAEGRPPDSADRVDRRVDGYDQAVPILQEVRRPYKPTDGARGMARRVRLNYRPDRNTLTFTSYSQGLATLLPTTLLKDEYTRTFFRSLPDPIGPPGGAGGAGGDLSIPLNPAPKGKRCPAQGGGEDRPSSKSKPSSDAVWKGTANPPIDPRLEKDAQRILSRGAVARDYHRVHKQEVRTLVNFSWASGRTLEQTWRMLSAWFQRTHPGAPFAQKRFLRNAWRAATLIYERRRRDGRQPPRPLKPVAPEVADRIVESGLDLLNQRDLYVASCYVYRNRFTGPGGMDFVELPRDRLGHHLGRSLSSRTSRRLIDILTARASANGVMLNPPLLQLVDAGNPRAGALYRVMWQLPTPPKRTRFRDIVDGWNYIVRKNVEQRRG